MPARAAPPPLPLHLAWFPHGIAGASSCPFPVDGGCSGAPAGSGSTSGPFYQDVNLITNAKQSGQGAYVCTGGNDPTNGCADWNPPGKTYGVGVPPGTTLLDPASGGLSGGCSYSATGAPGSNGPFINCGGANPTITAIDQTLHSGVYIEFTGATGTCTIKNSKLGAGANGVTWANSMVNVKTGNSCDIVFDSDFVDLQYPSVNYLADFVVNNSTGNITVNRTAWLHAAGRLIEQNSSGTVLVENTVVVNYAQTGCCGHGEFLIIDVSGSPAIGTQTYSNVTIVEGSATPQNEVSAPIYTLSGTGTPTYGNIDLDHVLTINNNNAIDSSQPTTESALATIANAPSVTLNDIRIDPTGALFCSNASGTPSTSWTSVVDILNGSTVSAYGTCFGVHP